VSPERQGQNIDDFPHVKRWKESIAARPAVVRAYDKAKTINTVPSISDDASKKLLFGQDASVVKAQK
jgi:GST-like protein